MYGIVVKLGVYRSSRWTQPAIGLLLLLAIISCNSPKLPQISPSGGNPFNPTPKAKRASSEDPVARQFGVLNPSYDFNKDGTNVQQLATRMPVRNGDSRIAVLTGGTEFLAARLALLQKAKRTVLLQALIFSGDEAGYFFAQKLIELKQRGLNVRVIVDAIANMQPTTQMMYTQMAKAGIEVEGFDSIYAYALGVFKPKTGLADFMDEANRRYHDKMFVIDPEDPENAYAIVGGANFANKYFHIEDEDHKDGWQDRDVVIHGSMVQDIAKTFELNSQTFKAEKAQQQGQNTSALWTLANWAKGVYGSAVSGFYGGTPKLSEIIKARVVERSTNKLNLQFRPVVGRFLQSRPRHNERYIANAYIDCVNSATQEILINNSYFVPTRDFQEALKNAAKRGVKVTILTNAKEVSDFPQVQIASRRIFPGLLSVNRQIAPGTGQLRIFEWSGDPILHNGEGLNHSKYAVFDRKVSIVGSFNIDPRSRTFNSETVVVYESAELSLQLAQSYEREISPQFSVPITEEKAATFTDPDDFLGKLSGAFAEILTPIL